MSWVRIHDGAMTHPKIIGLTDKAFRLWVWGLSYSQQHLTDGSIPSVAVPARLKRASEDLVLAGLWRHAMGAFQIHDYLDYNDSKMRVRERQDGAKRRLDDWRDKRASASEATRLKRVSSNTFVTPPETTLLKPNQTKEVQSKEHSVRHKAPPDPCVKEFLIWFQAEYKLKRHGAVYLVDWAKDAAIVKMLLLVCDLERLKNCARILLSDKTDDPFIAETDRGIGILKVKYNWLSDRLATWEANHAHASQGPHASQG